MTGRPAPEPSTCQACGHWIRWVFDNDDEPYGWWIGGPHDGEVCGGTEDGWHRPMGATADNGWPRATLEAQGS